VTLGPLSLCEVNVVDRGVDALVVERPGLPDLLVLRPGISMGAAIAAVCAVMPHADRDEVRALVRAHLPEAIDMDSLLAGIPEGTSAPDARPHTVGMLAATLATGVVLSASLIVTNFAGIAHERAERAEEARAHAEEVRAAQEREDSLRAQLRNLRPRIIAADPSVVKVSDERWWRVWG
jgi:hypothetical protein